MRVDGEEAVIPGKFAGGLEDNCPVKAFAGRDLARHDRIFNHLAVEAPISNLVRSRLSAG